MAIFDVTVKGVEGSRLIKAPTKGAATKDMVSAKPCTAERYQELLDAGVKVEVVE